MKISIAQLNPIIGDIENNADKIIEKAQLAVKEGAKLLLTPELSLCGYPPKDLLLHKSFIESMESNLYHLARQIPPEIAVLVGTVSFNSFADQQGKKPLYNSTALISHGKISNLYHKRLLPTYDVFEEDRYFSAGNEVNFFSLEGIKIGITICEDLWNDEQFWGKKSYNINPIQDLVNEGVDLIVNLSASPYIVGKQKVRESLLKHIVNKYNKPIIYVNQVGGNDDLIFDGFSCGVNQKGETIARCQPYQEDLIYLELDENNKDLSSNYLHDLMNTEEEEIYQALVLGVKDYARKCGFSKAILGLSGGIDSALVATIAVSALGKDNVLGVLMPSPYSSEHSVIDGEKLVKNLGVKSEKISIEEAMKSFDLLLNPLFKNTQFGIAEENLQSRIRGTLLMAIANKFGYLLLSTGNKSEMAVGYCTLYGDMNGGLAVIADVPKTKVFSLCKWINRNEEIIPNNILVKPPSAELKPNQKDEA